MTLKEIQELIKLLNKSDLTEFKMKDGDFELSIRTKHYEKTRIQAISTASAQPMMPISSIATPFVPPAAPSSPSPAATQDLPASSSAPAEQSDTEDTSKYLQIKSPMVGTFYRSSSPEKPPYAKVGDRIEKNSVVCIIEAMKLFNEVESEIGGKIVKVMVEDAQPVEYDQVLFLVDPKG
ncbi:MAG: acetyl-CoA carboxylase, biotin carboxyl carrier protein [Saprospiraceae bacterium]|nr:MAG: acetyl-CoA carboxylase, biotin carboxyl carrier protein [Saprospiraceae bacterium]